MNGLGLLQVSELGQVSSSALSQLGAAAPPAGAAIGILQGAATGAVIAGLAAWSGKAAATGALLGAAVSGVLGGATMAIGAAAIAQQGEPVAPELMTSMKITAAATLATGVGLGIWAGYRISRVRKGR